MHGAGARKKIAPWLNAKASIQISITLKAQPSYHIYWKKKMKNKVCKQAVRQNAPTQTSKQERTLVPGKL